VPSARSGPPSRRLPALLAALCDRLPDDSYTSVHRVLAEAFGPDDSRVTRFVAGQHAAGLAHQLMDVVRAWRAEAPGLSGAGLALALATARSRPRTDPAQVVVSGPLSLSAPARLTSGVALEVIRSATSTLLLVSFAAYGARDIVEELAKAVDRGVHVDLLLEETTQAAEAFAALPSEVHVWHRTGTAGGVLHAKLVAADRHTALLGSANLTDRALSDNIELGVVLRDPRLVEGLIDHFRWLLMPENGIMRRA
jgi:phosphatidylserine/phosphatidylglycerophosphate/cardiolipin synthase-like enzyme